MPVTDVSVGSLRALFFIYSSRKFLIVTLSRVDILAT